MMLQVEDIHTYYGTSHIIQGLSLDLNVNEVVCLIGRNGAGKTTTLRSIMGLTPIRKGQIRYKNEEITGKTPYAIARKGIGYVPEDRRIFSDLTVKDNLEIARRGKGDQGWTIPKIYEFFPKLEELEDHLGSEMSGGEQQMLAIARSLMGNPELILIDEPSQGLAPIIVESMVDLLKRLKEKISILLVEQNVILALDVSDRGYVIEKGMILYQGSMEDLKNNKEIEEKYLAV
jgi:branched-chain amino acid transport system ATP-binding protein